jgi:hypothetical protein
VGHPQTFHRRVYANASIGHPSETEQNSTIAAPEVENLIARTDLAPRKLDFSLQELAHAGSGQFIALPKPFSAQTA